MRFADEVWRAAGADPRALPLAGADNALTDAWTLFAEFAGTWGEAEGPVHTARLEFSRAAWSPAGLFRLALGEAVLCLSRDPPSLVKHWLLKAITNQRRAEVATALGSPGSLAWATGPQPRAAPAHTGFYGAMVANALWTRDRMVASGYLTSPLCSRCGCLDTVHHRLWECRAADAVRAPFAAKRARIFGAAVGHRVAS